MRSMGNFINIEGVKKLINVTFNSFADEQYVNAPQNHTSWIFLVHFVYFV